MKGRVDDEDLAFLIGGAANGMTENDVKGIEARCRPYITATQGNQMRSSESGWFTNFIATAIEKERLKVLIYILHRQYHICPVRRTDTPQAERNADLAPSQKCINLAWPSRTRNASAYKASSIQAWPESEYTAQGIQSPIERPDGMHELYPHGKRDGGQRLKFWFDKIGYPQLVSFYRPILDVVEIIDTSDDEIQAFYAFALFRMIHAADDAFFHFTLPRMENRFLRLVSQVEWRMAFEKATKEQQFFAKMRSFSEVY